MASTAVAHPGRTDSYGGHTCRTNCSKWGLSSDEYHKHSADGSYTNSTEQAFDKSGALVGSSTAVKPAATVAPAQNIAPQEIPTQQRAAPTPSEEPSPSPTPTPTSVRDVQAIESPSKKADESSGGSGVLITTIILAVLGGGGYYLIKRRLG